MPAVSHFVSYVHGWILQAGVQLIRPILHLFSVRAEIRLHLLAAKNTKQVICCLIPTEAPFVILLKHVGLFLLLVLSY